MNRILALDEEHGTISVEAGVTLGQAESFCRQHGFSFPLDLGAKDSCQIGGNLSTNAGGSRYVRFGSLHGTILGLEVVLADGTILDLGTSRQIRKDNTGYDLKHLFIGSEGTLGIITKATLACAPAPHRTQVALAGIAGAFPRVRHWLREARHHLAERLYAFEVMDAESMTLIHSSIADFRDPFREPYAFYILIETSISSADEQAASSPLESWLEKMTQSDSASDVILAQDLTQCASLWQLRESLPELVRQSSPTVLKYDLSLPLPVFYEIVERTRERLRHQALDAHVYSWGHLADGNLHLNVASHVPQAILRAAVEPWLYDWTSQHGGSCSAEHGIGRLKSHLLARTKGAATLAVMKQVKTLLDPNGILNPYKLFEPGS
jgi:D-2-hydroxyglutarate dehydrogenase